MTALEARKLAEDDMKAGKTPKYNDLRDWLEIVDSVGELKKIDGADWNLEMGTLAELLSRETKSGSVPAVLFDNVPGYPKGFRTLFAQNASFKPFAGAFLAPTASGWPLTQVRPVMAFAPAGFPSMEPTTGRPVSYRPSIREPPSVLPARRSRTW